MSDRTATERNDDDRVALEGELRDCLAHFHDYAYLVAHPFLARFANLFGLEETGAVREFRRTMTLLIERLCPTSSIPKDDPAWRPYRVLYGRYILGKELGATQLELQLSKRQIQREQRRGFDALLCSLLEMQSQSSTASETSTASSLRTEVAPEMRERERMRVSAHIARAIASVEPLANAYRVSLCLSPITEPLDIDGYPALFRQLLVGILSLAIRRSEEAEISVDARMQNGHLLCACRSCGSPLRPDHATPLEIGAVLAEIAKVQNATVTAIATDSPSPIVQIQWPCGSTRETVVMVEDNADLVSLLSLYLEEQGYALTALSDSRNAVACIRDLLPDYVVLDVVLEDVDGWEILRQLKGDARTSAIPTIICSVLQEPELALALGADAYLAKPVRPSDLRQCLSRLAYQQRDASAALH